LWPLRSPSGNIVDSASEDWWGESWADDATKLLGPEWMAGQRRRSRLLWTALFAAVAAAVAMATPAVLAGITLNGID
jgi:hypothetical protein